MSEKAPYFSFLRSTPDALLERPPLASSLQSFEASLFLISLGLYPTALVACATAWESVLKAAFNVSQKDRVKLYELIERADKTVDGHPNWDSDLIGSFRKKRNHIAHYGYTPRDDKECAGLLLKTGLPGLSLLYEEFFDYRLMWQQTGESVHSFDSLSEPEMNTVGMIPYAGDLLWLGLDQYSKKQAEEQIDPTWFFLPIGAHLRQGLRSSWASDAEVRALETSWERGALWEDQRRVQRGGTTGFEDCQAVLYCPVCNGVDTLVVELKWTAIDENRIEANQCFCAGCHLRIPPEVGFLAHALVEGDLLKMKDQLLKEFGQESGYEA